MSEKSYNFKQPKVTQFTIIYDSEKQEILTFDKHETEFNREIIFLWLCIVS